MMESNTDSIANIFQVKEEDMSTEIDDKFDEGQRCNITFSDKVNGFNFGISVSKNIPEGVGYRAYLKDLSEDVFKFFKERRQRFVKESEEIKKDDPQPAWKDKKASAPREDVGVCSKCSSPLTPGKNGKKPYCKPCFIKWKKEQEQGGIGF